MGKQDCLNVYEIVDFSDDEMYLPIGIFSSLKNAIEMVESWGDNSELDNAHDDFQKVTIRERPVDRCASEKEVWTRLWSWDYEKGAWSVDRTDET
jgi:hypothetical protein